MKPENWQLNEALERLFKNPEYHDIWKMPIDDLLRKIGLLQLEDLIRLLEEFPK